MKKKIFSMLAGAVFVLLLFSTYALPAVWYVKTDGSDSNSGASWGDAFLTIQRATTVAPDGDEIWVKEGTYFGEFEVDKTVSIYGGFDGTETEKDQRDWENSVTVISGWHNAWWGLVLTADAVVDGFTITGLVIYGGIFCKDSSPTIANCTITGNINEGSGPDNPGGGGICIVGDSSPTITNCTVSNNEAVLHTNLGGGIYISSTSSSPTVITNCTISNNGLPMGGYGGGIYCYDTSPTINNCTFINNTASNGGGIYNVHHSSPTITNCLFTGNVATSLSYDRGGGGMFIDFYSEPILINCTFTKNSAAADGGAIFISGGSGFTTTVVNSIIWNNTAGNRGQQIIIVNSAKLSGSHSNLQGGQTEIYQEGGTTIDWGSSNIAADPSFVSPLLGDFHLQSGSPCIDTGDNTAVPAGVTTDFEGEPRIFDGDYDGTATVDMGADEFQPSAVDTTDPSSEMTTPSDGVTSVSVSTNIVVHVRDSGSGVNQSTIVITVEGIDVTSSLTVTGDPSDYTLTYNPSNFGYQQQVDISVEASDLAGNAMSDSFSFTTESYAGNPFPCTDDNDCDGIPDDMEDNTLFTDKYKKTLFVKPSKPKATPGYEYWPGFVTLLPLAPFTNAGIEIVVIGDPNNLYEDMQDYDYDPTGTSTPCDILEIIYRGPATYCSYGEHNEGHTYFESTVSTWYWDTKGYTPNETDAQSHWAKYGYYRPEIYPFPLHNYFTEGAYLSIAVEEKPSVLNCTYNDCDMPDHNPPLRLSPMNLNDNDYTIPPTFSWDAQGHIVDYGTVESDNSLFFCEDTESHDTDGDNVNDYDCTEAGEIWKIGSPTTPNPRGTGYVREVVLRRTIVHEIGHALLDAAGSNECEGNPDCLGDHCTDPNCIMYFGVLDWEIHDFGPGDCIHKPDGSKDIRARGIVHNTVH